MQRHLIPITELLMGAAFADPRSTGRELGITRRILLEILDAERLPTAISDLIVHFNPAQFEVCEAVPPLAELPKRERRAILEYIDRVHQIDGLTTRREDAYLEAVAYGLGLEVAEFSDLCLDPLEHLETVEFSAEDLSDFAESLTAA
jgi:hypothetical protein